MRFLRNRAVAVTAAVFGLAAVLGGSLGMAFAEPRPNSDLLVGPNFVGGPKFENVAPGVFVSCLPQNSWEALYIFNGATQEWEHHFNTTKGVPAYVNRPEVGGIAMIRRVDAVAIIMDTAVADPFFIDRASTERCP